MPYSLPPARPARSIALPLDRFSPYTRQLTGRAVVEANDDGLIAGVRMGDAVLPGEPAEIRQLVRLTVTCTGEDVAKRPTF